MIHFLDSVERSSSGKLKLSGTDYSFSSPPPFTAAAILIADEKGQDDQQTHVLGLLERETSSPSSSFSSRSSSDEEDLFQLSASECYQPMGAAAASYVANKGRSDNTSPPQIGKVDANFPFQHLLSDFGLVVDSSNSSPPEQSTQQQQQQQQQQFKKTPSAPTSCEQLYHSRDVLLAPSMQSPPPVQSMVRRADDPYVIIPSSVLETCRINSPPPPPPKFIDDRQVEVDNSAVLRSTNIAAASADEQYSNSNCREKHNYSAADNTVLSASTSRRSDCSTTSANSFAFPILEGAGKFGSVNVESGQQLQQQGGKTMDKEETKMDDHIMAPTVGGTSWCPCVVTCSICW